MNANALSIRRTQATDRDRIVALHLAAFGAAEGQEVACLTGDLLDDPTARPLLSLVAEEGGEFVGHVLFTKAGIAGRAESPPSSILAPLGVAPAAQGRGVGGKLVREGLKRLHVEGVGLVFVLGHIEYYPRFGFVPARQHGLVAPYPIPDEVSDAWMVQELEPGLLGRVTGTVQCAEALDQAEHWAE